MLVTLSKSFRASSHSFAESSLPVILAVVESLYLMVPVVTSNTVTLHSAVNAWPEAFLPSVVAVMVTSPAATAVILPFSSTVALLVSLEVHFTVLTKVSPSLVRVATKVSVYPTPISAVVLFKVRPVNGEGSLTVSVNSP